MPRPHAAAGSARQMPGDPVPGPHQLPYVEKASGACLARPTARRSSINSDFLESRCAGPAAPVLLLLLLLPPRLVTGLPELWHRGMGPVANARTDTSVRAG